MTEERYLLQFRSETHPREEYVIITANGREEWDGLAEPGFTLTAAAAIPHISKGSWAYFLEPEEHRYWLRDEREDNLPS